MEDEIGDDIDDDVDIDVGADGTVDTNAGDDVGVEVVSLVGDDSAAVFVDKVGGNADDVDVGGDDGVDIDDYGVFNRP